MATVSFTLMSINGFSGTVMPNPQPLPPGITMTATGISAGSITITAGATVVDQWVISAISALPGDQLICVGFTQTFGCIWLLGSTPSGIPTFTPTHLPDLFFPNCPPNLPNFAADPSCLGVTTSNPHPNTLTFQVGNNGLANAGPFDVAVFVNQPVTLHVAGLAVGAQTTLSTPNPCIGIEFCHITITIDPTNDVKDPTRSDNVFQTII
jgi:hypothetical protein